MLAVLPQMEEAVEEYLGLQEMLCQGEKLQTKLQEEMAFLEGAENHPDHLILTLDQRSECAPPHLLNAYLSLVLSYGIQMAPPLPLCYPRHVDIKSV